MAAAALLIQLDSYARPSEILNVKKRDVMASTSKTCKYWGIIFGKSEFGEFTKAKQQDDTVLLDSLDRTYAPKLWKIVFSQCRQQNQLIFGSISLKEYGNLFKQARKDAGLAQLDFRPRCVRHSGPSCDFSQKTRTATEIQARGRWGTQKAILRYQKPGQMLARMRKIPLDSWDAAERALPLVMQKLQRHFSWVTNNKFLRLWETSQLRTAWQQYPSFSFLAFLTDVWYILLWLALDWITGWPRLVLCLQLLNSGRHDNILLFHVWLSWLMFDTSCDGWLWIESLGDYVLSYAFRSNFGTHPLWSKKWAACLGRGCRP